MNISELWQENADYVLKICARYVDEATAEDIRQEVFLRIISNKKPFNKRSSVKTWLYSITFRCCMDYYRKRKREQLMMDELFYAQNSILSDSQHPIWEVSEVSKMPCPLSQLFVELYYGEGWSMKEIAGVFEMSLRQTKKKILIGVKQLQSMVNHPDSSL